MKKIAIVTAGVLSVPAAKGGGVETLTEILLNGNEKNRDFEFTVFTIANDIAMEKQKNYRLSHFVNIKDKPAARKRSIVLNKYLYAANRRTLKKPGFILQSPFNKTVLRGGNLSEYDVVLVESNFSILSRLKKAGAKKVLYHAHYNDVRPSLSPYDKQRYSYGYRFVDANISVSEFIQRDIQTVVPDAPTCYVVRNCTPHVEKASDAEKEKLYAQFGIPKEKTILMYAGRLTPEKGVTQLLSAFRNLNHIEDLCLVVAGGAFYSDNTESEYVKSLKDIATQCTNPIVFTGYIAHSEMLKLWQLAQLAVLPTYDVEEAAGLVLIEALSAGVPAIHTDSGGMMEYSSSECAVVVPRGEDFISRLSNEIEHLCRSPETLKKMRREAFMLARRWSPEDYYKNMVDAIRKILEV